ncbi:eCIS core domain-containing protein [Roseiflexus sp.]
MRSSKTKLSAPRMDCETKLAQRVRQTAPAARVRDVRAQLTTPTGLLQLQRTVGNRAVNRLIQAKLIVGSADDPYEREAASAAARFGTPASAAEWPEQRIQTLPQTPVVGTEGGEACDEIERQLAASRGEGTPLPPDTRVLMENHLGADFSDVRVHTDARASALNQQLGSQAFTYGTDIYVGEGRYNPQSAEGQRLLAHELTHVVQQTGSVQRRAGHEPVSRSAPVSIQRLITSNQLKGLAGEPHHDKKIFGLTLWRMSSAYKSVLNALDAYHQAVEEAGYVSGRGWGNDVSSVLRRDAVAKVLGKLMDVETECEKYVASHADDAQRTPHIRDIIDKDIPAERDAIQTIRNRPSNYPDMSLKDAIRMARIVKAAEDTALKHHNRKLEEISESRSRVQGARPVPRSLEEAEVEDLSREAKMLYEEEMNQLQQPKAENFRGNSPATSLASALGYKVNQDYFRSFLAPALSKALAISEEEAKFDPADVSDNAQLNKNRNNLKSAYEELIKKFQPGSTNLIPIEFAKFCYSLYEMAEKKMGGEEAHLLVSSQIFLRTINPMITYMSIAIPEGQPGRRALMIVANCLQRDANYKGGEGRMEWMPSYSDQIKSFVESVIRRGKRLTA